MPGIGVILNPFSKKFKKNPYKLDHMAFIIGDRASYKPTEDMDDLYRVADEFKSRDVDILAISGGDGTIHCTLSAMLKIYGEKPLPKITFLRGGTLNTIASTMGIKGSTEKLMSDLLVRYHEGDGQFETRKLRLTKINDAYGSIFGLGVIYRFMDEYYKSAVLNPLVAAKTFSKVALSALIKGKLSNQIFKRFDADVYVNGKKWPFSNYTAIFSGSIRQIGLDFNVFHYMLNQNDLFHALGLSMTAQEILPKLKKIYDGKILNCPEYLEEKAETMEIYLDQPMPYTIDGDMLSPEKTFKLSLGPLLDILV